ncbi:hypothetical protein N0V85_009683 [Neurospora sp. IMI 360204]|nr:hypothetical protein N0V85_009683 [Neurospora sp. IMI 360204]
MLDVDLKLYMDLSSLGSGVSSMLDSVVPGLGEGLSNLLGANNLPASPSNPPTTQRSRFRTLPCGTSLGSLPGGNTTTVPINDNTDGPDGNGNGNGNGNDNGNNDKDSGSSAIEECIKRCEQDAITTSLELMNLRDCLGVTVDRKTTVDNCLYFVGPKGEKLPILDLGVVVDMTGLLGEDASGAEGVESAVRDGEEVAGDAAAPAVDTTVDTATDAAGDTMELYLEDGNGLLSKSGRSGTIE